jgi:heme-degrading monooxygenase HmoA
MTTYIKIISRIVSKPNKLLNYTQQFNYSASKAPGFRGATSYWQNKETNTCIVISDWSSTKAWENWSKAHITPKEIKKSNEILIATKKPNDIFLL